VTHLSGQVAGHEVDAVGQVFPGTGDAWHLCLAAELAFGAHFARHARHFRGEAVELVHHRVDGVLELENFAAHVDGDLARQVAARDGGCHLRDVTHLVGQIAAHSVDRIGQVFPGSGDARHKRLAAQLAVGADFARDARNFRCERTQLVHHRVDGFLQLKDFTTHVDGDFLGQVAVGDGDGDFGDVANLRGQVARHRVHALGEVLPHAGHFAYLRLTAQLALGAHFARNARHFRGEHAELLDHRVYDGRGLEELAFERAAVDFEAHRVEQIALRDRGDRCRHFLGWPDQIVDQRIDRGLYFAPGAA